jgi:histidinol phosphatase-like enzyme (inositol monophosphatase family)
VSAPTRAERPGAILEAAVEVARLAGDVAQEFAAAVERAALGVETKADGSPVTAADRAAERRAREWIEARFPDDGILGEEFGATREGARRRWILDPIDGTMSFVRGVPLWGTLVAVAEDETVLAGVAYFPALGEIVAAAPGEGCWWNDGRCAVSRVDAIERATVLTSDDRFAARAAWRESWRDLAARAAVARTWGDCYGYLLVATGRAEVMVDELMSPWDAAAVMPIVEEAGGVFTDLEGRRTAFGGSAIATNGVLASAAREILRPGDRSGGAR